MSGVVTGTKAKPGDPVDVCSCGHIADWHYQIGAANGLMIFGLRDGTRTRCPSYRCPCERLYRDGTRELARIPTPTIPCRAQRC